MMRERSWAKPCRRAPARFTLFWRSRYAAWPAATALKQPRKAAPVKARGSLSRKMFAGCSYSACPSADSESGPSDIDAALPHAWFLFRGQRRAVADFVGGAAHHHVAGFEIAHDLDVIAIGRALFHVHPLRLAIAGADYESALGGGDHAGLGDEQRGTRPANGPLHARVHA